MKKPHKNRVEPIIIKVIDVPVVTVGKVAPGENGPVVPSSPRVVPASVAPPPRPTLEDLLRAESIELARPAGRCPMEVGGCQVSSTPRVFDVASILAKGESYLRSIANEPGISVRIVR